MVEVCIRIVWGTAIRAIASAAALGLAVPLSAQENAAVPMAEQASDLPLFAIVYEAGPNWTPGVPMAEQGLLDHFYYMRDLHQRGLIVIAGPMGEDGGLVILRAAGQPEANQVIAGDPAVRDGKFVGTATPFAARFTEAGR
jgi:uncharacterized protein YciI